YARTRSAQAELVEDLRRERPNLLLFRNAGYGNAVDGVSVANSSHLVLAYVLSAYRPAEHIADQWFWRRAARPLEMRRTGVNGRIEAIAPGRGTLELRGWVSAAGATVLYVAHGEDLLEVAQLQPEAGGRAAFSVSAPVAFLGNGPAELTLAVYDPAQDALLPLQDGGKPLAIRWPR